MIGQMQRDVVFLGLFAMGFAPLTQADAQVAAAPGVAGAHASAETAEPFVGPPVPAGGRGECIPPGPDCWDVPIGAEWLFGSEFIPPIPADFFGPGSDPFEGHVVAEGASFTGPDLVVQRLDEVCVDPHQPTATVPIELVALSLRSVEPIHVMGSGMWHVEIQAGAALGGIMEITREDAAGGTVWMHALFFPVYTFIQAEPPFDVITLDAQAGGFPPVPLELMTPVPWSSDDAGDLCGADGFVPGVYTERFSGDLCTEPMCLATPGGPGVHLCGSNPGHIPCWSPVNDLCSDALVAYGETTQPFNTRFATHDGPGTFITGPNLWYSYLAERPGEVRISTCGSDYNTKVAVYRGDCSLPPVATNDDFPLCGLGSRLHVRVEAGESLLIEVGGLHQATGEGWLSLSVDDPTCPPGPTPDRDLQFDYDNDGRIDLHDLAWLQDCFGGPGVRASGACAWAFDTDEDGDVDLDDYVIVPSALVGPGGDESYAGPLAPICPEPGVVLSNPMPGFAWSPCDGTDVRYRLSLHEIPPGRSPSDVVGTRPAWFILDDLTRPAANYPDNAAPVLPGRSYAWQVDAYPVDNPADILCSGPPVVFSANPVSPADQLRELLKHLEEIRRQLEEEIDDLEDNPLVKEIRLIEALGRILSNLDALDDEVIDALTAFINCDTEALNDLDADVLDKALEILQGLIKLVMAANDDLSGAERAVLQQIVDQIQNVRDGLGDLATIKEITSEDFDVWEYLQGAIADGIADAAKKAATKALAKIIGAKAAGALVSIALDLYAFIDALSTLDTIEDLIRAWNITMLQAIEAASAIPGMNIPDDWQWLNRFIWVMPCEEYEGASFKVTPSMRCWQPDPDGEPGEGAWVECDSSFTNQGNTTYDDAEDAESVEFDQDDMETETVGEPPNEVEVCKYHVSVKWDPSCEGPCYLVLNVQVTKADGTVEQLSFLAGVKG